MNTKLAAPPDVPPPATGSRLVRYKSASDDQVRWGSNDDPRTVLTPGQTYTVKSEEVHSWHTKLELVEHPGLRFNSVHFSSANN